jgi:hypothetical protein
MLIIDMLLPQVFTVAFFVRICFGHQNSMGSIPIGKPAFVAPDKVVLRVPTIYGIVSFRFQSATIYDESLPSDFLEMNSLVAKTIGSLYETNVDSETQVTLCLGIIAVQRHEVITVEFDPNLSIPCQLVDVFKRKLDRLFGRLRLSLLMRIDARARELGPHTHSFEKLYVETRSEHLAKRDDQTQCSISWPEKQVSFKQEFPFIELSIQGADSKVLSSFASISIYFDWSVLNSAITERRDKDLSFNSDDDVIEGKAIVARRSLSKQKLVAQVSISDPGVISLSCIYDTFQSFLTVASKDETHMRTAAMEHPARIIWAGVRRICSLMRKLV